MLMFLHKQARTTPAIRQETVASDFQSAFSLSATTLWMTFWGALANFVTRDFRVQVRADAFDAMLRSTWLCPHRMPLHWFTSPG